MTHAFFKALLFLAAGSVIIGMHHDQDMRKMGGLRKYMPITWITSLIGSLALIGTPFFSGFYSKDSIIAGGGAQHTCGWASGYAHLARADRRVRHGVLQLPHVLPDLPRQGALPPQAVPGRARSCAMTHAMTHGHGAHDDHAHGIDHATARAAREPVVVWVPLVLLAIPSVVIGGIAIGPMLFGGFFDGSIFVDAREASGHGACGGACGALRWQMGLHAVVTPPFWLALAGVVAAWFLYFKRPALAGRHRRAAQAAAQAAREQVLLRLVQRERARARQPRPGHAVLEGRRPVPSSTARWSTARRSTVGWLAGIVRRVQTGFLYSYAFWMVIGLALLLGWFLVGARLGADHAEQLHFFRS